MGFLYDQGDAAFAPRGLSIEALKSLVARAFGSRRPKVVEAAVEAERLVSLARRRPGSVRVTRAAPPSATRGMRDSHPAS